MQVRRCVHPLPKPLVISLLVGDVKEVLYNKLACVVVIAVCGKEPAKIVCSACEGVPPA